MANTFRAKRPTSIDNPILESELINDLFLLDDNNNSIKKARVYSNGRIEIDLSSSITVHVLLPETFIFGGNDESLIPASLHLNNRWIYVVSGTVTVKHFEIGIEAPKKDKLFVGGAFVKNTNLFELAKYDFYELTSFTMKANEWYGLYCDALESVILIEYKHKHPNTNVVSQVVSDNTEYKEFTKSQLISFKKKLKEQLLIITSLTRLKNNNYHGD